MKLNFFNPMLSNSSTMEIRQPTKQSYFSTISNKQMASIDTEDEHVEEIEGVVLNERIPLKYLCHCI
jgi:hypothetical protein